MALENIPMLDANEVSRKITADLHTTDEYAQVVKIGFGADGTVPTLVSATDPLPIEGTLSITGEDHMGSVSGNMSRIQPTMTITAGAYAAGEVIGGELTLTNAMRVNGGTGLLRKLMVIDKANVKPELRCLLFDSNPAGTYTDNGLPAVNTADYDNVIAEIHVESTDYVTIDDTTDWNIATIRNVNEEVAAIAGSRDLYAVFLVLGAPTFTATDQLVPTFWFVNN